MANPLQARPWSTSASPTRTIDDEPRARRPPHRSRSRAAAEKSAAARRHAAARDRVRRAHAPAAMNEILTVHPRQYRDAQVIAENFREGIPVIINLSQMSEPTPGASSTSRAASRWASTARSSASPARCSCCRPSTSRCRGEHGEAESEVDASFFAQQ